MVSARELPIPQTKKVPKADLSESAIHPAAVIKHKIFCMCSNLKKMGSET